VVGDEDVLPGGDEVMLSDDEEVGGEVGGGVLSTVGTSKRTVPIPGRPIATLSRWQAAKLIFGGHLR
jgi:hypothetical protein